jgi:DNA polymerase-1
MKDLFIIDASGYIYRSYFAIRNITNSRGESTNALFGFIRSVSKLIQDFQPSHIVAVFDGPQNIQAREAIYSEYKAHRPSMPPDLLYQIQWARDFCALRKIPILNISGVEADDTMGTVALWAERQGARAYMCTTDKDMYQLVNDQIFVLDTYKDNHIIDAKGVEEKFGVPPSKIIDFLSITGDASDNVPGVSGFGPKTAASLLQQFGSLEYILSHPEEVPGKKKQETLIQEAENARLSKKLVTVITDVNIPSDESFYRLENADKEKLKEFYADKNFNTLIRELENETPAIDGLSSKPLEEVVDYLLIDSDDSLKTLIEELSQQPEVALSTFTTDEHPFRSELIGISLAYAEKKAWYVPFNSQIDKNKLIQTLILLFENGKTKFFGHNIKQDIHVLFSHGIKTVPVTFDTMIASYLLNSHSRQHSLETLMLDHFGKVKMDLSGILGKGKKAIQKTDVPLEHLSQFCCEQLDYTVRLKNIFKNQLQERKLIDLFKNLELPLLSVLADMERKGIFLDKPFLESFSHTVTDKLKQLEEKIYELAGETFNINSPKQLGEILFTKLSISPPANTGKSTSVDVLEALEHPIAKELMEYRTLEKLRSTYVDSLPSDVNPKTERIHCNFNQSVAATGRLSCQDPNLQNIPVRTDLGILIRQAFRPQKEGWKFLAADYSQIELRLLAHLSEDPSLVEAFRNNEDVHVRTAAAIFNVNLDQVTKEMRYQAKAVNFGVVYGQGSFGLAKALGIDVKSAKTFIDAYFKQYSLVREYLEASKESARRNGKSVTLTGRERLIPEINSKNMQIRSAAERLAINTPLQGTAADLIKIAMLQIHEKLLKERKIGYMVLQVHDELIFEIPDFEIISIEPIVKNIMENVFKLKVPLIVDISIGKNWKEC